MFRDTQDGETHFENDGCGEPSHNKTENWERTFRDKLENVLDEYFPKIEKEGEEKRLNKRSQALVLFAEAAMLAKEVYQQGYITGLRETAIKLDKNMVDWLKGTDMASKEIIERIREEARKEEREYFRKAISKKKINGTVFLDTQVEALLSLIKK